MTENAATAQTMTAAEKARHEQIREGLRTVQVAAEQIKQRAERMARTCESLAQRPYTATSSASWMVQDQNDLVQYGTQLRMAAEFTMGLIHASEDAEELEFGKALVERAANGEYDAVYEYGKKYSTR